MSILFACACGKSLNAPDGAQGKRARCPKCGAIVTVPAPSAPTLPEDPYELRAAPAPSRVPAASTSSRQAASSPSPRPSPALPTQSPRAAPTLVAKSAAQTPALIARPNLLQRYGYFLLLLALIPLVLSAFQHSDSFEDRVEHTLEAHPDLLPRVLSFKDTAHPAGARDEFFAMFPDDRLEGALFSHETRAHWLLALAAIAVYFVFLLIAFPGSSRFIKGLLFAGIFTGTVGILLLLFFQWAAVLPISFRGGVVGLVFLIVRLIGLSYALADSENVGFFLSFIGFTCGVGLCEEVTKIIPLLFRIRPIPGEDDPSWQSLLLWGLASGVGFGIAEGIMYSGRYYNGVEGADIYAVRFLSCVVLHAIWAGANGIGVYRRQAELLGSDNNWEYAFRVVQVVWVPMVLHGLYDTLLKKDHDVYALVVAIASFGWLAWQIERAHREEPALAKI